MSDYIWEAIRLKRVIRLTYTGTVRYAEPYIFGVLNTEAEALSAYQTGEGSASGQPTGGNITLWQSSRILFVTEDGFEKRSSYNPDDNRFGNKYCRI